MSKVGIISQPGTGCPDLGKHPTRNLDILLGHICLQRSQVTLSRWSKDSRGSSSFARLFEGIKFSVKFGEHLFARDAFATVELCKSFGDVVAQLLAPYLIALLSLFEQ